MEIISLGNLQFMVLGGIIGFCMDRLLWLSWIIKENIKIKHPSNKERRKELK